MIGKFVLAAKIMSEIIHSREDESLSISTLNEEFIKRYYDNRGKTYSGEPGTTPAIVYDAVNILMRKRELRNLGGGYYVCPSKESKVKKNKYRKFPNPKHERKDPYVSGKAYLSVRPCKRGHVYKETGLTLRYKIGNGCVFCMREAVVKHNKNLKQVK